MRTSDKKTFTINEDLGLLKKVRKQERLRGDFWFWKLFWESWELFSARHEHSISVPDSTSLNHCLQTSYIGTTLQPLGYGPPRAGGSARVAKVLAFASFGLQILESDMSCNVFTS